MWPDRKAVKARWIRRYTARAKYRTVPAPVETIQEFWRTAACSVASSYMKCKRDCGRAFIHIVMAIILEIVFAEIAPEIFVYQY